MCDSGTLTVLVIVRIAVIVYRLVVTFFSMPFFGEGNEGKESIGRDTFLPSLRCDYSMKNFSSTVLFEYLFSVYNYTQLSYKHD